MALMAAQLSMFKTCLHAKAKVDSPKAEAMQCSCQQENDGEKSSDNNPCEYQTCIFYFHCINQELVISGNYIVESEDNAACYNFRIPTPLIINIEHPPKALS